MVPDASLGDRPRLLPLLEEEEEEEPFRCRASFSPSLTLEGPLRGVLLAAAPLPCLLCGAAAVLDMTRFEKLQLNLRFVARGKELVQGAAGEAGGEIERHRRLLPCCTEIGGVRASRTVGLFGGTCSSNPLSDGDAIVRGHTELSASRRRVGVGARRASSIVVRRKCESAGGFGSCRCCNRGCCFCCCCCCCCC
jgi:hypothetical protein